MNKKVLGLLAIGLLAGAKADLNAQIFLPSDSLKLINFRQVLVNAQNNMYFVAGTDLKGDFKTYSGIKYEFFEPEQWSITPLLSGEVLYSKGKKVRMWNPYSKTDGDVLFKTKEKGQIGKLVFSPDGKYVLVVTKDNKLNKALTDTKVKEKLVYSAPLAGQPTKIDVNKQANVALLLEGNKVEVFNLERGASRKVIDFQQDVLDVDFSANYREFAVLLADGTTKVFNANDLKENKSYPSIKGAQNCVFHSEGKYLIVNTGSSFQLLNLLTSKIDYIISIEAENVLGLDVLSSYSKKDQLFYYKNKCLGVYTLDGIERYHTMDLKRALDLQMSEWSKMREGETDEEYRNRVNDENRAKVALQLEYDIVSSFAGNLINEDGAKLGKYVEKKQALAIDFNNMPSIYLDVPSAELNELNNIDDIEFFNTIYALDENDKFEVIYTEARNKHTGSVYMYDNKSRKTISFEQNDFVPVEVIQLANVEAARLETMKEEIIAQAQTENLLTEHTHITVNTNVEDDYDADGNKILNYNIDYQYQVEEEFSENDDFKSGKYVATESNAAKNLLDLIEKSLEGDFSKYLNDCSKVIVSITGSADAAPIKGMLRYRGEYGDLIDQIATQDGELTTMTVTKQKGIRSNEELALMRAYGVGEFLKANAFNTIDSKVDYKYNVEVAKENGSAFRRIKVALKFVDTFKEQMNKN